MAFVWSDEYYVLPNGGAIWKPAAKPCRTCGRRAFIVVRYEAELKVQCPECCKLKRGGKVVATLDITTWEWTDVKHYSKH